MPAQSAEGNLRMKASIRCSRRLQQVDTIRAKIAAHQEEVWVYSAHLNAYRSYI